MKARRTGTDPDRQRASTILKSKATQFAARLKSIWAEWMSKRAAGLSTRTLYIILVLFVCGGTFYNTLILTGLWTVKEIRHGNIAIPKGAIRDDFADSLIGPHRGIQDLRTLRATIDSLKSSKEGRAILDSISLHRPGLLDSVRAAEQMLTKY